MNATILTKSILPTRLQAPLDHLASVLSSTFGDSLLGLTVFGPTLDAAVSSDDASIETVVVLSQVDLPLVRRMAEHGADLGRRGFAAPLLMTPEYINASLDAFPLELIEIHQQHVAVVGQDCFEELTFADAHVRLQCEREFKRILLRIRQGLLSSGGQPQVLEALELDIGRHVLRTMRGFLWLKGRHDYYTTEAVIAQCGQIVMRPLSGVTQALRHGGEHGWHELVALYDDAEALATAANQE